MIDVTSNFKSYATANGREISCKIFVGDSLVFTDNEIMNFTFDDIVFPTEFCFGSTCANRFHFQICSSANISVGEIIRPFITFKGADDEWCPLGEFYVSRRYRRGNYYSITSYDKMYSINNDYETKLSFPTTIEKALKEICESCSLIMHESFSCPNLPFLTMPTKASFRDVIGYIAGAMGGWAKFDRYGYLKIKQIGEQSDTIYCKNYTDMRVKQDPLYIKQIDITTENGAYSSGKGTKITTYSQYNPVSDNKAADYIFNKYKNFKYYGCEIKMQGIPYLEAGEVVLVQDDCSDLYYNIIIGEMILYYDGSLRGEVYCRSRDLLDVYDDKSVLEKKIESIYKSLMLSLYKYTNENTIYAGQSMTPLIDIDFDAYLSQMCSFNGQAVLLSDTDTTVNFVYKVNDVQLAIKPKISLIAGQYETVCLHTYIDNVTVGSNNLRLFITADSGTVTVEKKQAVATVMGQYLKNGASIKKPDRSVYETIPQTYIGARDIHIKSLQDSVGCAVNLPVSDTFKETSGYFIHDRRISTKITDKPYTGAGVPVCLVINDTHLRLVFDNPVSSEDLAANLTCFNIGAIYEQVIIYKNPIELVQDSENSIIMTTDGTISTDNVVAVLFDNYVSNIISCYDNKPLEGFSISITT